MAVQVCCNAQIMCSFGLAPGTLIVLPAKKTLSSNMPAATIMDNIPMSNITPCGMCSSMANPAVAAATAAAWGVLTPQPCTPVIPAPWTPGVPKTLIGNVPAIDNTCILNCAYGGVITIVNPGQTQMIVG